MLYPIIKMSTSFILCILILTACTNEEASVSNKPTQSALDYQPINSNITVKSRAITKTSTFESTLYPLLKTQCGNCHGETRGIIPQFANSNLSFSLGDVETFSLVNFDLPDSSKIVLKLKNQLHNCWSNCDSDSNSIAQEIINWRDAYVQSSPAIYKNSCENCHGADGQGSLSVPAIRKTLSESELVALIETTMPPTDPNLCIGPCAIDTAAFISQGFTTSNNITNLHGPLAALPQGPEQLSILCTELASLNRDDIVNDVFCGPTPAKITSLDDLQTLLKLKIDPISPIIEPGAPIFTLLTHSSSLVARFVSSINPRAIIYNAPASLFGPAPPGAPGALIPQPTVGAAAMGFARGEQFVELFARDRITGALFFYLFTFEQTCNTNNQCGNADLLTNKIENNWTSYNLYSQSDLQNTVFDCLHCHQPDGPGTPLIPRMQEINFPWTHYISWTDGGMVLRDDFTAAHPDNLFYANIPNHLSFSSDPFGLEVLIGEIMQIELPPLDPNLPPSPVWRSATQPNQFESFSIEEEVKASNAGQPLRNLPPGKSNTWNIIYEASVRGEFIPVPYHDVKVTNAQKLRTMTNAINQYNAGTLAAADFPDIRQVFLDEAARDMGFQVKAGLDGPGIIIEACTQCHNSKLDQTISKARFNVNLAQMSDLNGGLLTGIQRDEVILSAIQRMRADNTDIRKMPPELFKHLTPAEIELAASYLCAQLNVPAALCGN